MFFSEMNNMFFNIVTGTATNEQVGIITQTIQDKILARNPTSINWIDLKDCVTENTYFLTDKSLYGFMVDHYKTILESSYAKELHHIPTYAYEMSYAELDALTQIIMHSNVTKLSLNHTYFPWTDNWGAESLLKSLFHDSKLTYVNFSNTVIDTNELRLIAENLKDSEIIGIDLSVNYINELNIKRLVDVFKESEIQEINLNNNTLYNEGAKYVFTQLQDAHIHKLDLSANGINDSGLDGIADFLKNPELESIDLSFNWISDSGVKMIAENLVHSPIKQLNLAHNKFSDEGINQLSAHLKNSNLSILNLEGNSISENGVKALIEGIKGSHLLSINLGNNVSIESKIEIAKAIHANSFSQVNNDSNLLAEHSVKVKKLGLNDIITLEDPILAFDPAPDTQTSTLTTPIIFTPSFELQQTIPELVII